MTFREWVDLLERDYPYIKNARVETHSVHQGNFYGKHALQVDFIINTGLVFECDDTRHADGTPKKKKKKEESQCGTSTEVKE